MVIEEGMKAVFYVLIGYVVGYVLTKLQTKRQFNKILKEK